MSRFPSSPDPDPSRGEVPPPPVEVTHRAEDNADAPADDAGGFPRWLGAAVAVLVIGGGAAGYFALRSTTPEPASEAVPAAGAGAGAEVSPRANSLPRAESAGAVPSLATSATNAAAATGSADGKPAPAPRPELLTAASQLTIAAVIPGPRGRAMINGRMREIGDEVSPGLVLREIGDGQLIFADEAGALYPRRF